MAKASQAPSLHDELAVKQKELVETKRSHAAGELVNPRALGRIRKEIARIHTKINDTTSAPTDEQTVEEEKK